MSILVATTRSPFFPLNGWECNGTRSMEISIHIAQWTISRDHNQPIKWLLFNIVLYKFRLCPFANHLQSNRCTVCHADMTLDELQTNFAVLVAPKLRLMTLY